MAPAERDGAIANSNPATRAQQNACVKLRRYVIIVANLRPSVLQGCTLRQHRHSGTGSEAFIVALSIAALGHHSVHVYIRYVAMARRCWTSLWSSERRWSALTRITGAPTDDGCPQVSVNNAW